ncbi:MAG: hypothetical protein WBO10_00410 [Pyrinomonadaceae bacterium]
MNRFAAARTLAFLSVLIFANSAFSQTDSIYRLPAGTKIKVKLDTELNSKVASVNDTFLAMVTQPVTVRETVVLPTDTVIEGRVTRVSRATGGLRNGKLDVVFETLKFANINRRIEGEIVTAFPRSSSGMLTALSIVGGAVGGALIGSRTSGSGALIGAGIGTGIGTGIAFLRKGKEMRILKGEEFEIELKKEVVLPVLDY